MEREKLVYIGHEYHNKTLSTKFLICLNKVMMWIFFNIVWNIESSSGKRKQMKSTIKS